MIRSIIMTCAALVALPGVAAAQSATPTPLPRATVLAPISPGSWLTNDDYPKAAWRAHMAGEVGFVLSVDNTGHVTGCTVVATSGWPLLDTATCDLLMKRAHFRPAAWNGVPVPASYHNRFRWILR